MKNTKNLILMAALGICLSGCEGYGRPNLQPVPPTLRSEALQEDLFAAVREAPKPNSGSLWQPNSQQFFQNPRAQQVGDILTVVISEQAQAASEANTETTHEQDSDTGVSSLFEFAGKKLVPGITTDLNSSRANEFTGEGSTDRSDSLQGRIAAMITGKLPNGYLFIEGRREVLVNFEKQIMTIQGIVRPGDITAENTISSDKIAEARISYAGEGIIDETQNAPYGARFLQRWLPF